MQATYEVVARVHYRNVCANSMAGGVGYTWTVDRPVSNQRINGRRGIELLRYVTAAVCGRSMAVCTTTKIEC